LIGVYKFDTVNSVLLTQQGKVSFSAKESELLQLLNNNANVTIEREVILKTVWGDDGDYIGRTLDVFISKLRKKLEANTNLKIVNIRGVGYKLVIA
jgi:DNA-binding response OmpR family regulator